MVTESESAAYHASSPSSTSSPSDSSNNQQSFKKTKAGRKKFKETRHPVYRGVRQRNGNKWVCEVREPNKKSRIWLGTYPMPEMAARAHDVAVLALRGTSAVLNFPHSASLLPVIPKSFSSADIREVASRFAKDFKYKAESEIPLGEGKSQESTTVRNDDELESNNNENSVFFDEEAVYNMPGLLDSMAEGLLITPPSMKRALDWDDVECVTDLTLWGD